MRYTLLIGFLLITGLAHAWQPIQPRFDRGCAPFTVQMDTSNLNGQAYVIVYQPGDTLTDLTYTFTNPGAYDVQVYTQASTYEVPILVEDAITPDLTVFTCSDHNVQVQLNAPNYDSYELVFAPGDTVVSTPGVNNYTHDYGSAGTYTIRVKGSYTGAADNCPTAVATVTTRGGLIGPTLNQLFPQSNTVLDLQADLATNTDHRLDIGVGTASSLNTLQEVDQENAVAFSFSAASSPFHCASIVAYDICSGEEAPSDTLCTAGLTVSPFVGYNELEWVTDPLPGRTYRIFKNGVLWRAFTSIGTTNTLRDSAVVCNEEYTYEVRILHPGGAQSTSLPVTVTGLSTANIPALSNPTASVEGGAVLLNWAAPSTGQVTAYYIFRAGDSIGEVPGGTLSFTDNTASPADAPVCYRLEYQDNCENISAPTGTVCTIHLSQGEASSNSVVMNWTSYQGDQVLAYELIATTVDGQTYGVYDAGTANSFTIDLGAGAPPQQLNMVVHATLADGSTVVLSNMVSVYFNTLFALPNAFTPDGDGLNDTFTLVGSFIGDSYMEVFNRWGEIIFQNTDVHRAGGWDGTYANQPAPAGIYTYYIRVSDINGVVNERRGRVFLLRER